MKKPLIFIALLLFGLTTLLFVSFNYLYVFQLPDKMKNNETVSHDPQQGGAGLDSTTVRKSNEEWKKQLTPEQYNITCGGGTEPAFTGKYWNNHEKGKYQCVRCNAPLFDSDTKYDSGSGWPSFYSPAGTNSISTKTDKSIGMVRTEVICKKCGSHLGHLFDDGPKPTGMRYCINSGALNFKKEEK